jgi:hypothetical protein
VFQGDLHMREDDEEVGEDDEEKVKNNDVSLI